MLTNEKWHRIDKECHFSYILSILGYTVCWGCLTRSILYDICLFCIHLYFYSSVLLLFKKVVSMYSDFVEFLKKLLPKQIFRFGICLSIAIWYWLFKKLQLRLLVHERVDKTYIAPGISFDVMEIPLVTKEEFRDSWLEYKKERPIHENFY